MKVLIIEQSTRDEMIDLLKAKYPNKMFRTTEEFDGTEGGIWTSGEDGQLHKGLPLFNYYSQDGGSKSYTFGVLNFLHNWLGDRGWYCEWYDAGTVMIWKI
jgi:hypothetical protein